MGVTVTLMIGGQPLVAELDDEAIVAIAAATAPQNRPVAAMSPYMTVPEAAEHLRCSRQRIDDLLSQRRLTRFKDGRRTLILRSEVEGHLRAPR